MSSSNTPGCSDNISDFKQSEVETFQRCFPHNPGKFCTLINTQKEALIQGSAGTGKTLLLLEKARRLTEKGHRVLVLTFNIKLAEYLQVVTRDQPLIQVDYFHHFCEVSAKNTGISFDIPDEMDDDGKVIFYEETSPDILLSAIETGNLPEFDAVLIDEGQDFNDEWWVPLMLLIKESGWFYIFMT